MDENHAAELLISRCQAGDNAAWEELVRQYHRRIYSICYRFTGSGDEAEDLTQDVFIRVYRTLGSYDSSRANFMTWVSTLTRNLLVDHFRKSKYDRQTDSLEFVPGDDAEGVSLGEQLSDPSGGPDSRLQTRETREMGRGATLQI